MNILICGASMFPTVWPSTHDNMLLHALCFDVHPQIGSAHAVDEAKRREKGEALALLPVTETAMAPNVAIARGLTGPPGARPSLPALERQCSDGHV